MLGAHSLGLNLNCPKVTVSLHSEYNSGLQDALSKEIPPDGCCEIVNSKDIQMEYKCGIGYTGHLVANFGTVQLRGVKRLERLKRDDRVTEEKYGMIFYTKIMVLGRDYHLKVSSLRLSGMP